MNHTPGPWKANLEHGDRFATVKAEDGTQSGKLIAVLKYASSETCDADAKIMAAAPDMLEALQEAKLQLGEFNSISPSVREKMYAAIAKATE